MAARTKKAERLEDKPDDIEPLKATPPSVDAEDPPVPAGFNADELTGELGDWLAGEIKAARSDRVGKPWTQLTEGEQRMHLERCHAKAHSIVTRVAMAIADKGFESIDAILDGGSFKGAELVLKLKAPLSADNLTKITGKGTIVQLVFADAAAFAGEMSVKPQPDQPQLIVAGGLDPEEDLDDEPAKDEIVDPDTGEITEKPLEQPEPPPLDNDFATTARGV